MVCCFDRCLNVSFVLKYFSRRSSLKKEVSCFDIIIIIVLPLRFVGC